ncbi:hypothetical protein V2J09_020772 [Rumex salicifolius]
MDVKSSRIPELPSSVIIEILRRLPIKTLVHCRYVCKAWYTMLSEIYFYKLYSTRAPTCLMIQVKGDSVDSLRDIYVMESTDDSVNSRKVRINFLQNNNENDTDNEGQEPSDDDDHPDFKYQLGNSCNGLICLRELRSREPIAIWNPIMGQYVVLPHPATASDIKVVAGFGFSPRTKVYKVLRIFHEKNSPAETLAAEVYDFGVSGTTWRRIGDAPCSIPSRIPGCFVNSSLHWILDRTSGVLIPSQLICSFDFGEECFRYVSPPPIYSLDEKKYHWSNLGILAGCLSICAIDAKVFRPDVEVWVMDEYGVAESWVNKLSIRDPAVDWWDPFRWIQVTSFLKNGDIILLCGHRYVLAYDPRARTFVNKEGFDFPAIAHVLSFVSLKNALREDDPSALESLLLLLVLSIDLY